ncbi:DegT/DnrJ/EryC1/StrS family aminotransferase [Candidatus Micrarchaeota archaeon]|nr:DegT/DnrJ/EryC1/StrS family aminotransferase [Candidatus Micrarchaeota archaeon]
MEDSKPFNPGPFESSFRIEVGTLDLGGNERKYVNQALDNNRLSYGPFSQGFERGLAGAHGCKYGVLVNSGTSALRIAVAALREACGWKDGDEVLVPSLTFVASANVIIQNNLKPVFVDVDPLTYNIDPSKIGEKITSRTRGIMPVHLFGLPCDMDPIMKLKQEHGLSMIEDSCETMFARYKGRPVGSFGEIGCFSSYIAHLIVTGVGGMAITDDEKLAVMLRSLANHGRDSIYLSIDDSKRQSSDERRMVMERRFRFERLGYSFRVTELEAAIGCGQLERKEEIISARRANGAFLNEHLSRHSRFLQLPSIPEGREHSFMLYPIVVRKGAGFSREELTHFLEENGIETRHMVPLLNQPVYRKLFGQDIEENYPVAKWVNSHGFYIGCHQKLAEGDLQYAVSKFGEFFEKK